MVACGHPHRRDHLLCGDHVLPVGELPTALWRDPVYRLPSGRRMADAFLGVLLVVALPHQLRVSLHDNSWRTGHGHRHAAHPQLDEHVTGWRRRVWAAVIPGHLADLWAEPPAAGCRRRSPVGG